MPLRALSSGRVAALFTSAVFLVLGAPAMSAAAQPAATAAPAAGTSYRHGTVPTRRAVARPAVQSNSAANLNYGGGNDGVGVTTGAPQVYVVFWGSQWGSPSTDANGYLNLSGDPDAMAPDLQAFLKGLGTAGDSWSGVMTQYCEGVAVGTQTCPSGAAHVGYPTGGALAGAWEDTSAAAPYEASALQLAAEAVSAANHFGNVTQTANRNTQYMIVSPTGTIPDGFVSNGFCAWHDFSADPGLGGTISSPFAVAFTNLPYLPDVGAECGMNFVNSGSAGTLDGVTIVGGHEYAETITDQFPGGGWLSASGQETGDLCAWISRTATQGAAQDIALTTGSFAVQSTWANDFNGGTGGCVASHPIVSTGPSAPPFTSPASGAITAGAPGSVSIIASGSPVAALSQAGTLPAGLTFTDNSDGTATVAGTVAPNLVGTYPLTFTAANGVGTNATQNFTLTINATATITSPASATFIVGVPASTTVTATGFPGPVLAETGPLPAGVSFNALSGALAGTPAAGSAGAYPVSFSATNGVGSPGSQTFTLSVAQATLTNPTNGQVGADTTQPFTWSTLPQAQGYILQIGTAKYGTNLSNSGVLPPTQSSYFVPALPSGPVLNATLYAEINGSWTSYEAIAFTAAPGSATFTFPANGAVGVDPTRAFTWTALAHAQGYIVVAGLGPFGSNLVKTGILGPTTSSYIPPVLPTGKTIYATIFTEVNGTWSRYQAITFTDGPAMGTFVHPLQGQLQVPTPFPISWTTLAGAQNYLLIIGTSVYASNLVNTGILPSTQSSYLTPKLPNGVVLYATLFTKVNGLWAAQVIAFTAR